MSNEVLVDERAERWEKQFEIPVLVAAMLVVPVIAIEQSGVGEPWRTAAALTNWGIWLAIFTALGGGAAFAAVEGREVSTWDGLWWAITTMTTVGYGDLFPQTDLGRVIAIVVMLVGIGFIAILTAALAERFVAHEVAEAQEEVSEEIDAASVGVRRELRDIAQRLVELERRLPGSV